MYAFSSNAFNPTYRICLRRSRSLVITLNNLKREQTKVFRWTTWKNIFERQQMGKIDNVKNWKQATRYLVFNESTHELNQSENRLMGFLLFMSQNKYRILKKMYLGKAAHRFCLCYGFMQCIRYIRSLYFDSFALLQDICSRGFIERTHHSLSFI